MKIVGIDCGTERTGYGIVETDGRRHQLVTAGVIRTRPAEPLERRLKTIARELRELLENFAPNMFAVEEVFHAVNAKSALKLAHVRGVVLLAAAEAGLAVNEYSPLEVKMSVVGYGRAEKAQVQRMVRAILALESNPTPSHAADALAVAICHALAPPLLRIAG